MTEAPEGYRLVGHLVTRLDKDTRWEGRRGGVTKLFKTMTLAADDIGSRTYSSKRITTENYRIDPVYIKDNQ